MDLTFTLALMYFYPDRVDLSFNGFITLLDIVVLIMLKFKIG